jgi:CRISPR/Cas system CSM-associated protein Csm3 (group 7 of RAMP superfamily)
MPTSQLNRSLDRANLRARYLFTGTLVLDTALHIGGGRESSTATDSPILRDNVGRPLIPGSSFKGAFRAAVERLLPNLSQNGFRTCQLIPNSPDCLSTNRERSQDYGQVSDAAARGNAMGVGENDTAREERKILNRLRREHWVGQEMSDSHLLDLLAEYLCDTCKTFGSVHLASVTHFHDLPLKDLWAESTQIRDGVGIDRDSERAIDQIKFDYEVVPAQTEFDFRMTLENPLARDLGLVALGLQEFMSGMIPLGGIRSRGLGQCHLQKIKMACVDFSNPKTLREYLTQKDWAKNAAQPLNGFVEKHVGALLAAPSN